MDIVKIERQKCSEHSCWVTNTHLLHESRICYEAIHPPDLHTILSAWLQIGQTASRIGTEH